MLMNVISNRLGVGGSLPLQPCKTDLLAWNDFSKYYEREDEVYCIDDKMGTREDMPRTGQCLQGDGVGYIPITNFSFANADYVDFEFTVSKEVGERASIQQDDDGSHNIRLLWSTNEKLYFILSNGTLQSFGYTDTISTTNEIVCRFLYDGTLVGDENRMKILVNNVFQTLTFQNTIPSITANLSSFFEFMNYAELGAKGKIGNVKNRDRSGTITNQWNLNQESGSIVYDSIGTANGTLTGFDLTTPGSTAYPWKEDNRFTNVANDEGYTLDGAVVKPVRPNGLDVDGNTPTHSGRVKRGVEVIGAGVAKFNGVASVDLGRPEELNFIPQVDAFEIEGRFKIPIGSSGTLYSFGADALGEQRQFQILTYSGTIKFIAGGVTTEVVDGTGVDGEWHFLRLRVPASSTGLKIWIDGNEKVSNGSIGSYTSAENAYYGARTDGASYLFAGSLAQWKHYSGNGDSRVLAAEHNFSATGGNTIFDPVNNNHGTLVNSDLTDPDSSTYFWQKDETGTIPPTLALEGCWLRDDGVYIPKGVDVSGMTVTEIKPFEYEKLPYSLRYPETLTVMNKLDMAVYGSNFSGTLEADKFTWTPAELLNLPNTLQGVYHQQVWVKTPLIGPLVASLVYGSPLVVDSACYDKTVKYTGSAQ